jgi:UDP-3-O-[3-hydroxymyristoyl] N-acetylglucosamine deacetylase
MLDGSAYSYVQALQVSGRRVQKAFRRFIRLLHPIHVQDGNRTATLLPASSELSLSVSCDYRVHGIGRQLYTTHITTEIFSKDIASARTFGFFEDVDKLRAQGLAQGSSLENAIVFSGGTLMNPEGLRFPDEIVRHKVLDVLGDLALLGYPLMAHFTGENTGHALNAQLTAALLKNTSCWAISENPYEKSKQYAIFTDVKSFVKSSSSAFNLPVSACASHK